MRTRLVSPRFAAPDVTQRRVADASQITANYHRLVEKFNGGLDASSFRDGYRVSATHFDENHSLMCHSFLIQTASTAWEFRPPNGTTARLVGWALAQVREFNSSRRTGGRASQFGWYIAVTAALSKYTTVWEVLSTIDKPARVSLDRHPGVAGKPPDDKLIVARDFPVAEITANQRMRVIISTSMPPSGGWLVYVFLKTPWANVTDVGPDQD